MMFPRPRPARTRLLMIGTFVAFAASQSPLERAALASQPPCAVTWVATPSPIPESGVVTWIADIENTADSTQQVLWAAWDRDSCEYDFVFPETAITLGPGETRRVSFDLSCAPPSGGCYVQGTVGGAFTGEREADIFILVRSTVPGAEDLCESPLVTAVCASCGGGSASTWTRGLGAPGGSSIWTDFDGDGLPDLSGPTFAEPGRLVSVDLWIDGGDFVWTNYLAFVEWNPDCMSLASASYLISGGGNFPIDNFSHPNAVGFGGYCYDQGGLDALKRIGRLSFTIDSPGFCCVTPIIDPNNPYYVFSMLAAGSAYRLFSSGSGTCVTQVQGACCREDGTCVNASEGECAAIGGVFQGNGVGCDIVDCASKAGACCMADGSCQMLSPKSCEAAGGVFRGNGVSCEVAACGSVMGACCFPDGSCAEMNEPSCAGAGGIYRGDGETCALANCPMPTGACCLPDGACIVRTAVVCAGAGGVYYGDWLPCEANTCPSPLQACCIPSGCFLDLPTSCTAIGGTPQGPGTTCDEVVCPPVGQGACCFLDGSCAIRTPSSCASSGGVYAGNGTACATTNCAAPGACCFADGSCAVRVPADCASEGGVYAGEEVPCDPDPCADPTGACCFADGSCSRLTQESCGAAGGTYRGDFVSCNDVDCPPTTGACCFPNGTCLIRTASACSASGGVYQGDNVTCGQAQCTSQYQACCFDNGGCADRLPSLCMIQGGEPQGPGTSCATTTCPQPTTTGACCLPEAVCQDDMLQSECAAAGGVWFPNTPCSSVDCTTEVESTSWGKIKGLFR
jgi:hypothetical protein